MTLSSITHNQPPQKPSFFRLRRAVVDDIPELVKVKQKAVSAMIDRLHEADYQQDHLPTWMESRCSSAHFEYRIGRKYYHIWVAESTTNGRIVGYGGYRQRNNRADGSSVGLYVSTPGLGIGRALQEKREHHAREQGIELMRVSCWEPNHYAINFVRRLGFQPIPRSYRERTLGLRVRYLDKRL